MLAGRVSKPIIDLVTLKTEITKLVQSLQIISGIVDANSETTVRGQKPQLMGQVSFKNVEFGYDDNDNRQLYQYSLFPLIPSINYAFKF